MSATLAPPPHLEQIPAAGLLLLTFLFWSTKKQKNTISIRTSELVLFSCWRSLKGIKRRATGWIYRREGWRVNCRASLGLRSISWTSSWTLKRGDGWGQLVCLVENREPSVDGLDVRNRAALDSWEKWARRSPRTRSRAGPVGWTVSWHLSHSVNVNGGTQLGPPLFYALSNLNPVGYSQVGVFIGPHKILCFRHGPKWISNWSLLYFT